MIAKRVAKRLAQEHRDHPENQPYGQPFDMGPEDGEPEQPDEIEEEETVEQPQQQTGLTAEQVKNAAFSLREGWGIWAGPTNQRGEGFFIEKWPAHDEWYWKVGPYDAKTIEDENELDVWINEALDNTDTHIERYRVVDGDGRPIRTNVQGHDPGFEDQSIGEYEQHGPDPIRQTDLQ